MRILMVYPKFKVTFWSFKYLLAFIGKKAAFPPSGLLTVARMLPKSWEVKLVDMNVHRLDDEHIERADYVFISAMTTQSESAEQVIRLCGRIGVPVVLGGPILVAGCEHFSGVKHFLLGEVENTFPEFLDDIANQKAKRIYPAKNFPSLTAPLIPMWSLINLHDYASMLLQWGRGCPFCCTFCNIAALNGRKIRTKLPEQFIREIDALYEAGARGSIMLADDNFIGNRSETKKMLPLLVKWQKEHGYPFELTAEVDITLADDEGLMTSMVQAGFKKVFLGLETPNKASLIECKKFQNVYHDMLACVRKMQSFGLIPMSGFMFGFDADNPETFDDEAIDFIQKAGIAISMLSVLQAFPGTDLYDKLQKEGRLLTTATGNNTDCYPNFVPKMPVEKLVQGFKKTWRKIYSPRGYYMTVRSFLRAYNTDKKVPKKPNKSDLGAFFISIWCIGFFGGPIKSFYYWATLLEALLYNYRAFPEAVTLQVFGSHFRRFAKDVRRS